ncbi:MAG: sulfur carrier protein ThiS, partial [Veillonellaceae bacterium]|nr:sulfur carrier protein ThiS [Veillonellaceae bacterium]
VHHRGCTFLWTLFCLEVKIMIQAKINGQIVDLAEKTTIQQFLQAQNHKTDRVAVELNGQILPRSAYGQQEIKAEDTLEIVSFVGGG